VTWVDGVRVGHWTDAEAGTGCTVIVPPPGTLGSVDVRGGGPSTRETELLSPMTSVEHVTAVLLTGGSAFGLSAAGGVMRFCEEQGLGHQAGAAKVPIVPTAVIYDLGITANARRPGPDDAYAACQALAEGPPQMGSVGAGTGATVGKLMGQPGWCKGGLGVSAVRLPGGVTVAAIAVVNAFGDVLDEAGEVLAGAWTPERGFIRSSRYALTEPPAHPRLAADFNTTLVCVLTDGTLTKVEAAQVARMASAGLCRAVSPVHTPFDGDVVFCLSTRQRPASTFACGIAAAEVTSEAIRAGVRAATSLRGVPTAAERRQI
jgi:L-aminopeptidase/D-esterase-like protein